MTPKVEYSIECQPEDMDYVGNCSAIDEVADKETEEWIRDQLRRGNEWAWCQIKVTARCEGFEGRDTLGGCSYESEEAFKIPGGYFEDMKAEALEDLKNNLRIAVGKAKSAAKLLKSLE